MSGELHRVPRALASGAMTLLSYPTAYVATTSRHTTWLLETAPLWVVTAVFERLG